MIEGKLWLALKGRLDQWTECPIARPDEGFAPNSEQPYVIAQFVPLSQERRGLQWACGDELRGILNLSVCVPLSWDFAAHLGLANRVGALFPAGARYTYSWETAEIYERARVASAPRIDGGHNRIEVQIGWRSLYVPITDQVISILSGSGYAGSVYSSTIAGQWYADDVAIIGETGSTFTMTLEYEGAAIRCGESNVIQMWVPTSSLFSAVFDIRRNITLADSNVTAWGSSVGLTVAAQQTAILQPKYSANGLSGAPCMVFESQFLETTGVLPGAGFNRTVVSLVQWDAGGMGGTIFGGSSTGSYVFIRDTNNSGGLLSVGAGGVGWFAYSNESAPIEQPLIVSSRLESNESYSFGWNGESKGAGVPTAGNANGGGSMRIGRGRNTDRYMKGMISSLIVSETYLSDGDLSKAEGWLAHTLGQSGILSPDHPYKTAAPRVQ